MSPLLLEQLKEICGQQDWVLVHIKDEDMNTVMLCMGEPEAVEDFFPDDDL